MRSTICSTAAGAGLACSAGKRVRKAVCRRLADRTGIAMTAALLQVLRTRAVLDVRRDEHRPADRLIEHFLVRPRCRVHRSPESPAIDVRRTPIRHVHDVDARRQHQVDGVPALFAADVVGPAEVHPAVHGQHGVETERVGSGRERRRTGIRARHRKLRRGCRATDPGRRTCSSSAGLRSQDSPTCRVCAASLRQEMRARCSRARSASNVQSPMCFRRRRTDHRRSCTCSGL